MSSTGIVSSVIGAQTTGHGEDQRSIQGSTLAFPLHDMLRYTTGNVTEVREDPLSIKAIADDLSPLANDNWIPLTHSPDEIRERWGKLTSQRKIRVLVIYSGPSGAGAFATVLSVDGNKEGKELAQENTIKEALWEIFTPGSTPA